MRRTTRFQFSHATLFTGSTNRNLLCLGLPNPSYTEQPEAKNVSVLAKGEGCVQNARNRKSEHYLVDVSDIFYFLSSGKRGSPRRRGGGVLKIPRGGGGARAGRLFAGNWGGVWVKYFFWGRISHQDYSYITRGPRNGVFGKPCFCPAKTRVFFDENGENDVFAF